MKTLMLFSVPLLLSIPVFAQQESAPPVAVDVQHYQITVEVMPENSFLKGEALVRLRMIEDAVSIPFEVNSRLSLTEILDDKNVRYSSRFDDYDSGRIRIQGPEALKRGSEVTLKFRFEGTLEKEQYAFLDTPETERAVVHSEGAMLLSEGRWFPAHSLPLDAATVEIKATVPLGFTAVGPGGLQGIETAGVTEVFNWKSDLPVTDVPLLVSRYLRQQFKEGALPLTFFMTEKYNRDLKPMADEISAMLDFYKSEYGEAPIASLTLAQLGNVQLPSTGCAGLILLDASLLEPKTLPVMELAKRVANQWWGYSARVSQKHDVWLKDGFSTYAALRYIEVKKPDSFLAELNKQAVQALKYEKKAPIVRGLELGIGTAEYESIVGSKGAWVLFMLGQLAGRDKFNGFLGDWYKLNANQNTTTSEFVKFVREKTGEDYDWFFVQWVESVGIPEFRVEYTIYKLKQGGFRIRGQIVQNIELFKMPAEVLIETKAKAEEKQLMISGKTTSFNFVVENVPVRVQIDPQGKILYDSEARQVAVQVALGEEFREKGEFAEAIRSFEKARTLNPRSSLAHYRLGELFFEQHNYSSSANSFRESLNGDLKPEWVQTWTHIHLGKIYDILGERQRAMAEYQKAINTKVDYNGALAEAEKYLKEPFSKPRTVIGQ